MSVVETVAAWSDEECREAFSRVMARIGRRPRRGKWITRLAALSVGESFTAPATTSNANLCTAKHSARVLLETPEAQWKTRTTNKGLRVTRVR